MLRTLSRICPRSRCGFTLIELLVVIVVIGVLVGLLLPAVQKVRESANRTRCANNLKQLALAAHQHHDVRGAFPNGVHPVDGMPGALYANATDWTVELLPYFEQDNLYRRWDYRDHRNNVAGGTNATTAQVIQILVCPSDALASEPLEDFGNLPPPYDGQYGWAYGFYGKSSYYGNAGTRSFPAGQITQDGIFFPDSRIRLAEVSDGTSNTFLFGERSHRDVEYDHITRTSLPVFYPLSRIGMWGALHQTGGGSVVHHLLSAYVPINYPMPPTGGAAEVNDRPCAFGSGHPGGANFAFVDGSVRFVSDQTDLATLQALSTRAGGEAVSVP